jgi:putative colanic acid biosynthesis acetyltransferase WcaF
LIKVDGIAAHDKFKNAMLLNIKANKAARKWSRSELLLRVLWALAHPLFRYSPRVFWSWRVGILRLFGASIGSGVHIYPTAIITLPWNLRIASEASVGDRAILYNLGLISIGAAATISQGAHLCAGTHDYRRADLPLLKLPITIGEGAWICADSFVGPRVKIGNYAIVGARAVAMRDVDDWSIVVGNPARVVKSRPKPV